VYLQIQTHCQTVFAIIKLMPSKNPKIKLYLTARLYTFIRIYSLVLIFALLLLMLDQLVLENFFRHKRSSNGGAIYCTGLWIKNYCVGKAIPFSVFFDVPQPVGTYFSK
jgi:hypothetical protein